MLMPSAPPLAGHATPMTPKRQIPVGFDLHPFVIPEISNWEPMKASLLDAGSSP
jgi:hypothetical protein